MTSNEAFRTGNSAEDSAGGDTKLSYEQQAKATGMRYTLNETPSCFMTVLMGVQHYFIFLGANVLIPLLVVPSMGATPKQTAHVISTVFVMVGIGTLLQTTFGDRLPIVQGSSFAYLTPVMTIIANPELQDIQDDNERFQTTIRVIQGAVLVVGAVQAFIGYTGLFVPLLRYISPLTATCVISTIGLSLYHVGFSSVSTCFPLGLLQLVLTILFSQYLHRTTVLGMPVFALFPIILAAGLTWSYGAIMTASDVWDEGNACRTDQAREIIRDMPLFSIPYPGQWGGRPIFRAYAIVPMLGAMLAGMIEVRHCVSTNSLSRFAL